VLTVLPKRLDQRRITVDERFSKPPASELARIEREAKQLAEVLGAVSPDRLWRGPFASPVPGGPTSAFGRVSIVNGERRSPHSGIDLQAANGTPVSAPAAGRVVLSASLYYAGDTVIIDHGLGAFSLLAHLSERRAQPGDLVSAGDVVGLSGSTGRITGPHLHWGTRIGAALVDPFSLIAATSGLPR
jgi:murein DD-endopeptidase MepM/ murein hydrolase activator NlpD